MNTSIKSKINKPKIMHIKELDPVLCLEIDGQLVNTHAVDKKHVTIEYWRHRWFYQYGLASKKNWSIYIAIQSAMGNFKAKKFTQKEFPYLIKSKINQNERIENAAKDAAIRDIIES